MNLSHGTYEVHNGAVHAYEGGYAAYVLAWTERGCRFSSFMRLSGFW